MTPETKTKPKKPDYQVMTKRSKPNGTHEFIEVGVGFFHKDGEGINVLLNVMPIPNNGVAELVLFKVINPDKS